MSIIHTESLTRRYGRRRGVEAVDLTVAQGTLFGFLGPNGAGKTTTIRVLLGLLRPTSGRARIFGLDCWRKGPRIKTDVGYLPGDLRLYPWMSGQTALRIFGAMRRRDMLGRGRELSERFALDLKVKVRSMSRGMRQKLGLILALAHDPKLLILDEPTSALDPLMQDELRKILGERAKAGATVFFSSHSLAEVEQLCDRVAVVRAGKIVADESLEVLRRSAGHEVTIHWKTAAQCATLSPPPFLALESRDGMTWTARLEGASEQLVRWLAQHQFEDLTIGKPDLESLFRQFYRDHDE
ncbi:MAG: ABC transporter ATP-binding protein [Tepidisphaeraceae bacterium]